VQVNIAANISKETLQFFRGDYVPAVSHHAKTAPIVDVIAVNLRALNRLRQDETCLQ